MFNIYRVLFLALEKVEMIKFTFLRLQTLNIIEKPSKMLYLFIFFTGRTSPTGNRCIKSKCYEKKNKKGHEKNKYNLIK